MDEARYTYEDAVAAYIKEDYDTAIQIYSSLAEQGCSESQYTIGVMYLNGKGTKKNCDLAIKWFHESAERGHLRSQALLGDMYLEGECVAQDFAEAAKWRKKAFENDDSVSAATMACLTLTANAEERPKYLPWVYKAAEMGQPITQNLLGLYFRDGFLVTQDYTQAAKWFKKAAKKGNTCAQYNLGTMYQKGLGVKRNVRKAVEWYSKAAEAGEDYEADSQIALGLIYHKGQGVIKHDYEKAKSWYLKAAEYGISRAQYLLWVLIIQKGSSQEIPQAFNWLQKSAENGYDFAQYDLGRNYETGDYLKQDYVEAAYWYQKASEKGYSTAQFRLGLFYKEGKGVIKDLIQAHMWLNISESYGNINYTPEEKLLFAIYGETPLQEIERMMTITQIDRAREIAEEWLAK